MPHRTKRSHHVGILVETEDTWGRNVVESICRFGQRRRWTVLIAPRDPQGRMRLPKVWDGDGVIAALRNRNAVRHVKNLGLPVVDVSAALPKEGWFARVTTDDRARADLALQHLLQRGLEHFACYAPSIGRYSDARANEFRSLVESSGHQCAMYTQSTEATGWLNNYTRVREWLGDLPRPLGVFAGDPYPARQLMEICDLDNISVPDEIAILSGDDDELLCNVASPRISAIELASHQIGDTAAEILQRLMNRAAVPKRTRKIRPLRIRPRESTDLLAIEDRELARALRFIRSNADRGITVADVVRASHISRRGLEKRFRELLQRTPAEEIRRVRFEMVQRLLLDSNKTIATIADETGFSSGASLSQLYRQHFGETPGRFRGSRSRARA